MALDGAFLSRLRHEIETRADGARIDRIAQPSKDEIILQLRWRGGGEKLLLSANAGSARVHFTKSAPENPKSPPMFCMLLRKHLSSAKLLAVKQIQMDRILHLEFETRNELGDLVMITVVLEIMGRHSNIIIVDQEGRIIDAIKRIDPEMSSVRQVLPGMRYALPPLQDKLILFDTTADAIMDRLAKGKPVELSKALMDAVMGMSPLVCREIADFACRGGQETFASLSDDHRERLRFYLNNLVTTIQTYGGTPTMVMDLDGRPRDFSYLPIHQYGNAMMTREYDSYSELLDAFYARRDLMERMKQRSSDLLRVLANASDRIARKLALQREELKECGNREQLRIRGDLLNANLYAIKKGDAVAVVQNLYDPEGGDMAIELDVQLTPVQNAQRYYALYRKADTAEKMLVRLIEEGEAELAYVDTVFDALTRAETDADLLAIRQELADGGYVKQNRTAKAKKEAVLPPLRYESKDGFRILSGRNNFQNDRLTLKDSRNYDIWLHTQKIPGSHTIILADGREIPKSTIEQACIIAAYNSKARESSKVPVDFTFVKHVKKPNGAKPGMVIYDHYQTVIVDPDEELVKQLTVKQ
ncbi:NFACT family protein [Ruminococcaceae bacterium OttesenSCG-928-L11]|nr:NFACT family protein [Ruminococcaceae bacterium OttesenSCG-928-L11]